MPIWEYLMVLGMAAFLGGTLGMERELHGRWAGLRTHMMVSLGAAMFVHIGVETTEASPADVSRIVQGVAAGIGFIGAGTILKRTAELEVKGLTTASSIWLAAAIGSACGAHLYALASISAALSLLVLFVLGKVQQYMNPTEDGSTEGTDGKKASVPSSSANSDQ